MFVKPAPGLLIRDPLTMAVLPPEGREVGDDYFWIRRLRDGDVVQTTAPENSPPGPAHSDPAP